MTAAVDALGHGLGAVFGLLARVRRDKPLHPKGVVAQATLDRHGSGRSWGVSWLDEPGSEQATVRLSRSVGLPGPAPDVLGQSLRLESGGDMLLATTGMAPGLRHVLRPRRHPLRASYTSLFPYDAAGTWVVLGAEPEGARSWQLLVAPTTGRWRSFGRLHLGEERGDEPIDFDPVLHPLPGLPLAAPFRRLREPSYAAARTARA